MKKFLQHLGLSIFATIGGGLAAGVAVVIYILIFVISSGMSVEFPGDLGYLFSMATTPLTFAFSSPFFIGLVAPWVLLSCYFAPWLLSRVNALLAGGVAGLLVANYYFWQKGGDAPNTPGRVIAYLALAQILSVGTSLMAAWLDRRETRRLVEPYLPQKS